MGLFSSGSAKRAAQVQADKLAEANKMIADATDKYSQNYTPYMEAGQQAIGQYQGALGTAQDMINSLTPQYAALNQQSAALQPQADEMYGLSQQMDPIIQDILSGGQGFEASPGYQFRLDQGQKQLEASRAASGMLNSGATGKALIEYGQGMASSEFDKYMQRQYGALDSVNAQLGGRQSALGAGQSQIQTGLNIAGGQLNQITAQQNLANQYNSLIQMGYSAADAQAALGMGAAGAQAQNTAAQGDAYASGMTAKSNQLLGMGSGMLNAGVTLATGGLGSGTFDLTGGAAPQNSGGALSALPYFGASTAPQQQPVLQPMEQRNYLPVGQDMPWLSGNAAQQATTLSQSSYKQPRIYG